MSLVVDQLHREAGHSVIKAQEPEQQQQSYTDTLEDASQQRIFSPADDTYDDAIFDEFYSMDGHTEKAQPTPEVPALPPKSALRASRLLDNLGLKLGGSLEKPAERVAQQTTPTPLDLYLSSEEDASSSADDFSDYDYESGSEVSPSATPQRRSHEITARAVSVVFYGKPCVVELRRRSASPASSSVATKRLSTASSVMLPASSSNSSRAASTTPSSSSSSLHRPQRTVSLASSHLSSGTKKAPPPFLNIDPYANGSTYSLETTEEAPRAVPRTPTALLKGVSRTFGLMKKKSQPTMARDQVELPQAAPEEVAEVKVAEPEQTPTSPPLTYQDIVTAAKKNSLSSPPQPSPGDQLPQSPLSPVISGPKRGILSGLAARRRSIKLTGGR